MSFAIDVLLALGLVVLAWQTLLAGTLFRGIVMFLVFGLVLALVWARLGSADLAMAEAAIGTGVTGALLMVAYWRLRHLLPVDAAEPQPLRSSLAALLAVLAALGVAALGLTAIEAPQGFGSAGVALVEALPDSGLGNPITGVLIVYRNLDTVLEVAVLLAAFVAARAAIGDDARALPMPPHQDAPLVGALLSVLVPLAMLVALYLFKAGSQHPGGAFQAGAVLAALAVLLLLAGRLQPAPDRGLLLKLGLVLGTVVFSLVGLGMLALGQPLLAIPGLWAVYLIEAAMMVSIGLTLALLFSGSAGLMRGGPR